MVPEFVEEVKGSLVLGPYLNVLPMVTIVLFLMAAENVHAAADG